MDPLQITALTPIQNHTRLSGHVPEAQAAVLPAAPPELVSRFEALMAPAASPERLPLTQTDSMRAVVEGADRHMQHQVDMLDRASAMLNGDMSMTEVASVQMQLMMETATMSITQSAYINVLGSTKGAVSDLMKNQ